MGQDDSLRPVTKPEFHQDAAGVGPGPPAGHAIQGLIFRAAYLLLLLVIAAHGRAPLLLPL